MRGLSLRNIEFQPVAWTGWTITGELAYYVVLQIY